MREIQIEDRNNDLWCRDEDLKFAVILMYASTNETKFITAGPFTDEKSKDILEDLLNDVEQGRFVCLNSQFINPKYVLGIKRDVWKDKNKVW